MTKEEKETLLKKRLTAGVECSKLWPEVVKLKQDLKTLEEKHRKWRQEFEGADRILAEEEVTVVKKKGKERKLTKKQILRVAKTLGIEL